MPETPEGLRTPPDTPPCWAHHLGLWAIEPLWMQQAVALLRTGIYPLQTLHEEDRDYWLDEGVAVIPLMGPMTKGLSKFGGASTVYTRRALRQAAHDPDVGAILLHVDSPGGHVAGVEDLAREVYSIRAAERVPIWAHIDDLGASAAYWVASQTSRLTANATAEVGSIGTVAVVEDSSGQMDRQGIKVHVISTGPFKGVGIDGAALSEEALLYLRQRVEDLNGHFLQAIERGRGFSAERLRAVSDGRVWIASKARELGLIDHIQSFDTTLLELSQSVPQARAGKRTRALADRLHPKLIQRKEL